MKNFISFVACLFILNVAPWADDNEEAINDEAAQSLQEVLQGSENSPGGVYFGIGTALETIASDTLNSFVVTDGGRKREGTFPLNSNHPWSVLDFNVGRKVSFGEEVNFRYEGGLRWMSFNPGELTYTRFDFAPIDLETINENASLDADSLVIGPRMGGYLDIRLPGVDENYLYLGYSVGLMRVQAEYDLNILSFHRSVDDVDWSPLIQYEVGILSQLKEKLAVKFGYEFSRQSTVEFTMNDGSDVVIQPGGRHFLKLTVMHWYRRK